MDSTTLAGFGLLAQRGGGGAYGAGQVAGVILIAGLAGAILWKFLKKK